MAGLEGKRVLVPRAPEQADSLLELLARRGATPVALPTIAVVPPEDWSVLDRALERYDTYDWIVFTSANGVRFFLDRLAARGQGPEMVSAARVAAVGPATAAALRDRGVRVDLVPAEAVAEATVAALAARGLAGRRILYPRAADARPTLAEGLRAAGALVDDPIAYRTVLAGDADRVRRLILGMQIEVVAFTSPSTVRGLLALLGEATLPDGVAVACIGPVTARAARAVGLTVSIEAPTHTADGLVDAIERTLDTADRAFESVG